MADQLALLDLAADAEPDAPRCRMCARPARRNSATQQWGMYCNVNSCSNRERLCQRCGDTFAMGLDGAGTKYCSTECKRLGYHPERADTSSSRCAWCNGPRRQERYVRRRWPYVCPPCLEPVKHVIDRLRNHNVPHDRVRQLVADPGCEICGINVLERVMQSSRKMAPRLVVDHDHGCCPSGRYSCGKCVRGLVCHGCNSAAGLLRDDPASARALAGYLDRWLEADRAEP